MNKKVFIIALCIFIVFIIAMWSDSECQVGSVYYGTPDSFAVGKIFFVDTITTFDGSRILVLRPIKIDSIFADYIEANMAVYTTAFFDTVGVDSTDTLIVKALLGASRIEGIGDYGNFPQKNVLNKANAFIFMPIDSDNVQIFIGGDVTYLAGQENDYSIIRAREYIDKDYWGGKEIIGYDFIYRAWEDTVDGTMISIRGAVAGGNNGYYAKKLVAIKGYATNTGGMNIPLLIAGEFYASDDAETDTSIGVRASGGDYAILTDNGVSWLKDSLYIGDNKYYILSVISDSTQEAKRDTIHLMDLDTPDDSPVLYFEETDSSLTWNGGRGAIDIAGGTDRVDLFFTTQAVYDSVGLLSEGIPYYRNKVTITPYVESDPWSPRDMVTAPDSANNQYYSGYIFWVTPLDFVSFSDVRINRYYAQTNADIDLIIYKYGTSDSLDVGTVTTDHGYFWSTELSAADLASLNGFMSADNGLMFQYTFSVNSSAYLSVRSIGLTWNKK